MKYSINRNRRNKISKRVVTEDMQYLQKKISGRSVYRKMSMHYLRRPKHRRSEYQYF